MKKCANCNFESPDAATSCPACSTDSFITSSPEALGHIISPAEQVFWERMTFRHFAVFFMRLQAFWLFFDAIVEASYLVGYLSPESPHFIFTLTSKMIIVRMMMHIALAIFCLRYADRIVSWFIKDIVPKTPPDTVQKTAC